MLMVKKAKDLRVGDVFADYRREIITAIRRCLWDEERIEILTNGGAYYQYHQDSEVPGGEELAEWLFVNYHGIPWREATESGREWWRSYADQLLIYLYSPSSSSHA